MTPRLSIIGGYLGSGKSTLVNRLLAGALPGRTAVVVNDFGSINIDAELIDSSSEDTIELTNGCICCQINDDATRVMSALASRKDLAHVICEASGVADPRNLASWRSFPGYGRGPLVVCADATSITRQLRNEYVSDVVTAQLSGAEVIMITKSDIAPLANLEEARAACQSLAPNARVILQDPVDPDMSAATALLDSENLASVNGTAPGNTNGLPLSHNHSSATLVSTDRQAHDTLVAILANESEHLVRAKGIVQAPEGFWFEIHLAGGRITTQRRPNNLPTPQQSQLVLISAGPEAEEQVASSATSIIQALETSNLGMASSGLPQVARWKQ